MTFQVYAGKYPGDSSPLKKRYGAIATLRHTASDVTSDTDYLTLPGSATAGATYKAGGNCFFFFLFFDGVFRLFSLFCLFYFLNSKHGDEFLQVTIFYVVPGRT